MDRTRHAWPLGGPLFVFVVYTATAVLGFALETSQVRTFSVYLAPGVGFVLLWKLGTGLWPAVALAALAVGLVRGSPLPLTLFASLTVAFVLILMVHILRSRDFRADLSRARDALGLIGAASLASVAGALAFAVAVMLGGAPNAGFTIMSSWLGSLIGMLISAPPLLMWTSRRAGRHDVAAARPIETGFLFLILFTTCDAAFGGALGTGRAHYPLAFVPFPILLWIGLRIGPRALVTGTSLTAIAALFGSVRGLGPFASQSAEASVALDWLFLGVIQVTFLLLAAVLSDRAESEAALVAEKERAEAATRAKSEFLSVMNHELRTPLNSILLATDLMLESELSDEQRDLGRTVLRAGEALRTLVGDTLDMARIEEGRMELLFADFAPRDLSRGVVDVFADSASRRNIELEEHFDDRLPATLRGDAARLRQILINLVGNALKFTEEGTVALRTRCVTSDESTVRIRFEVSDSGSGIPREDLRTIFEPFTQVDGSSVRVHGGTGLGLAISRRLVELMDGDIGVESELGKGSTFWLTVPLQPAPARVPDVASAEEGPTVGTILRPREQPA